MEWSRWYLGLDFNVFDLFMYSFAPESHDKSGKNICSRKHFSPWLNATNTRDRVEQTLKWFQFDLCPICMYRHSHTQSMHTNICFVTYRCNYSWKEKREELWNTSSKSNWVKFKKKILPNDLSLSLHN